MDINNIKTVYFIGIGGISMSGLAMVLQNKGYIVKGSDSSSSDITDKLVRIGIDVKIGHKRENITGDIDLGVYTAAISEDNAELLEFKNKGITVIPRSKLLGIIMDGFNNSVAIAGTHGKTTTTSMITQIMIDNGLDPTVSIGGVLPLVNSNTLIGNSDYFAAEACEYTNSFLELYPRAAIVLNIDMDHIDYFKNMNEVRASFKGFISNVKKDGAVIINNSIDNFNELTEGKYAITYGLNNTADWSADNITEGNFFSEFDVIYKGRVVGRQRIMLPGIHNISNALAACAAAHFLGVDIHSVINSIKNFTGTKRRFELKGEKNGCKVFDDYAHHPSEIKATLKAAKTNAGSGKIWCVFQPHTFSRTKAFLHDFSTSFENADTVILTDIYASREKDPGDISSLMLLEKLIEQKKHAVYFSGFSEIVDFLHNNCNRGDTIFTMGAGNIYEAGESFLKRGL